MISGVDHIIMMLRIWPGVIILLHSNGAQMFIAGLTWLNERKHLLYDPTRQERPTSSCCLRQIFHQQGAVENEMSLTSSIIWFCWSYSNASFSSPLLMAAKSDTLLSCGCPFASIQSLMRRVRSGTFLH